MKPLNYIWSYHLTSIELWNKYIYIYTATTFKYMDF